MSVFNWTPPLDFEETNNVNSTVLNQHLSENLRYLFARPRDVITLRDIGSYSTTSNTMVAVDVTALRLRITLQTEADVMLWLNGSCNSDSTSNRRVYFDILMDGTTYLSSDDTTELSEGLAVADNANNTTDLPMNFRFYYPNVSAGSHYFDLYWRVTGNTVTMPTNPAVQFGVMEI